MSRRMEDPSRPEDDPGFVVSALIDVSFLLLIYFLVTSTLERREADLDVALPGYGEGTTGIDAFEIGISPEGGITLFDETLDGDAASRQLPLLRERLRVFKKASDMVGEKPLVIVNAHDEAHGQRFVDVLNCLAELGIRQVTLPGFTDG